MVPGHSLVRLKGLEPLRLAAHGPQPCASANSATTAKIQILRQTCLLHPMVPAIGVEPIRCCHHRILSPARLPVPPRRLSVLHVNILTMYCARETFAAFIFRVGRASGGGEKISWKMSRCGRISYIILQYVYSGSTAARRLIIQIRRDLTCSRELRVSQSY